MCDEFVLEVEIFEEVLDGYFKFVRWDSANGDSRAFVFIVLFGSVLGVFNWGGLLKKF